MRRFASAWIIALAVLGMTSRATAVDWPQWRGVARDGQVAGFIPPQQWPAELQRLWQVEAGAGHSSPLVIGDQVFLFSRRGEEESLACLALVDGKELWRQSYAVAYEMNPTAISHGKGPKSTPTFSAGRIFTLGITGILTCWDAKTGARVWQLDFTKQFPVTAPQLGAWTSPLIDGDRCIVFVGGPERGSLCAFEVATGKTLWTWPGDGPSYASPIVATISGVRQLITQSQSACLGIDPVNGTQLWKMPYKTEYDQNSVTPVVYNESVIFSGYGKGVERYRVEKNGDDWRTTEIWSNREVSLHLNSPVVSGDHMFGFSHRQKGQLFALDLTTGKTLWTSDGRLADSATLVRAGATMFALTTNAELLVFKDSEKQYEQLAHYKVAETPTWAHPVLLAKSILIKDEAKLTLWSLE